LVNNGAGVDERTFHVIDGGFENASAGAGAKADPVPCALSTIISIMVHPIEFPAAFFREAERVLQDGGRLSTIEPAITWGSTLLYRLFILSAGSHVGRCTMASRAPAAILTNQFRPFPPFW
jgi:hypothetical protein